MLKARVIPCLDVKDGRTVEDGTWEALSEAGGPLARLLRQS